MSSEPKKPLKGILKQPKAAAAAAAAAQATPQEKPADEARRIAVQRATIIQQQKTVQGQILESLIRLSEFPPPRGGPAHGAANPNPSDAAEFKRLVHLFQPTDYESLVEERNIAGLCGYALCARPHKTLRGAGTWKMVNKGRSDFDIVRTEELERWCSEDCARRALYVKVQLHETGAWERAGMPDLRIELLGEDRGGGAAGDELAGDVARLKLDEERKAAEEASALALERGDTKRKGREDLTDFTIREKKIITAPVPPSKEAADGDDDDLHLLLEGYKTR